MNCENIYCIYQENGHCVLDQVSLDSMGQCVECIMVSLEDAELLRAKCNQRERD